MICFLRLIKSRLSGFWGTAQNRKGVALFIVLASMATLAIFVSEITYTAQINQKLAYDRLDQVKAQALAKSGLRLALLRIRAYSELKKQVGKIASSTGASASAVNSVVPKAILEKIWSEPVTIPFTGDISGLPGTMRDALTKFRKDSGMEGKVYISIQAQSNKLNLNSTLPGFAALATPTPAKNGNAQATPTPDPNNPYASSTPGAGAAPNATPANYDPTQARQLLGDQIKNTLQKKFDEDEKFRDQYRNFRVDDLIQEIIGWADLSYDSPREQFATVPFKKAPFYHLTELHYLDTMEDGIYDLLADQFSAGVASTININTIQEPVLKGLIPQMTKDEVAKFFQYRDGTGQEAVAAGGKAQTPGGTEDNTFKDAGEFYKYLGDKVQYFAGSTTRVNDFKTSIAQRGIELITEESNFLVHIEATVQQTKKIMEAMVSIVPDAAGSTPPKSGAAATPTPAATPNATQNANDPLSNPVERSNLKITQLRFL